jgi:hypothetical protein
MTGSSSGLPQPNHYEKQFGDRIRSIRKGARPDGGPRWNGGVVAGILIGVLIAIMRIASNTSSPPTPQWHLPQAFHQPPMDDRARFEKALQELRDQGILPPDAFPGLAGVPDVQPEDPNSLNEGEVPLWEGLCYRIHQESLKPQPSPGRQICSLLDEDQLTLLRRAAGGAQLDDDERGDLLEAFNDVLENSKLYDAEAFRRVQGAVAGGLPDPRNINPGVEVEKTIRRINRPLLESAYPEQIVPARLKNKLDDRGRNLWKDRARRDLEAAKKQYRSRK